jgi:hypothetical protein
VSSAVPLIYCCRQCCGSDPGSSAVLTPGSGFQDGKNPDPGSGINIPDHIFESLVTMFWLKILNFFVTDPEIRWLFDPGSGAFVTLDPGWKNSLRIQEPGSATCRFWFGGRSC